MALTLSVQNFGGFLPFGGKSIHIQKSELVDQALMRVYIIKGLNTTRWYNTANDFVWLTDAATCLPVMTKHANDVTVYTAKAGISVSKYL